jgi:hypothetical protein
MTDVKVEVKTLDDLQPDPNNVNKHTVRGHTLVENSLRKRGAFRSVAAAGKGVDKPVVMAGNLTIEKARDAGFNEVIFVHTNGRQLVSVIRDDIEPGSAEAIALGLEDNESASKSYSPDLDVVAALAAGDNAILSALKSEDKIFAGMLEGMGLKEETHDAPEISADRFDEVVTKWGTAEKQLWKVGEHFIYCGDSLEPESIDIVLQGQEPVMVIADPPYGVNIVAANGYVGGGESERGMIPFGGVKNRRGTVGASKPFGSKAVRGSVGAAHIVEVGKYPVIIGDESTETAKKAVALYLERFDSAYHVWWGANYYVESVKPSPCWLVWNKETTGNFADCELAWSNADMSAKLFTHRWNGMLRDSERERRWHPTQKPAALAEWCCGLFTSEGDVILDPFGGAGWSLLGAQNSNRKACVIEKSHEYIAAQLERMSVAFPRLSIERLSHKTVMEL